MTKNTICGDITIERIDMNQPQRIAYTMTEPEIDSDTIDDAIAAFKKRRFGILSCGYDVGNHGNRQGYRCYLGDYHLRQR